MHIVRACMRIHNLAIDELGADAAESDARETLDGEMNSESREAPATEYPSIGARNDERARARRSEGERPSRRGERTDCSARRCGIRSRSRRSERTVPPRERLGQIQRAFRSAACSET